MRPPPPLRDWSKKQLIREVERLRAITREHAERSHDDARSGGDLVDVAGDPHARGGVVFDMRGAVLLDSIDVALVDTKRDEPAAMTLLLQGRVNYEERRTKQMFLFGPDGAAGLVSQLTGLAQRAGGEFAAEFLHSLEGRMQELP